MLAVDHEIERLAARRGVALDAAQADALAWDWPFAVYDLIALLYLHLPEAGRRKLHAKALAALKPGGIIVLDEGRIVEMGSHRELLNSPAGIYASFWAHQSGGFLVESERVTAG